jgi:hypothetical protein
MLAHSLVQCMYMQYYVGNGRREAHACCCSSHLYAARMQLLMQMYYVCVGGGDLFKIESIHVAI